MQARGLDAIALADAAQQCEFQPLVHPAAERGKDRQAELSGRVAKGLDQDRAVVRHNACNVAPGGQYGESRAASLGPRAGTVLRASGVARDRRAGRRSHGKAAPTAAPSSAERGESSPLQNGMTAVFPSAGPTTTRWASMASILQVLFPSAKASPTRRSKTNSSSSSPSRGPSAPRNTGNCPVSGIVPPPTRANRAEPGRAARRL